MMDPTYHHRHRRRTLKRAELIGVHLPTDARSFLDIGCNQGLVSNYLLDRTQIDSIDGIEISADYVSQDLKSRPEFSLTEGEIQSVTIPGVYDAIFYGAVHHHVLRAKGLGVATQTFRNIVNHCRSVVFFETGQLTEGPRWGWQRKLRRYFSSDEEHFHYLLKSIEPRLQRVSVIGRHWIHGVRRYLLKIELGRETHAETSTFESNGPVSLDREWTRSWGSRHYRVDSSTDAIRDTGVLLAEGRTTDDARVFVKRRNYLPWCDIQEWLIGQQIDHDWAVKPIARRADVGLVFPFIDGVRLPLRITRGPLGEAESEKIRTSLNNIWRDVCTTRIRCPCSKLMPSPRHPKLVDLIDFNINNIIVDRNDNLWLVDYEWHAPSNGPRNEFAFGKILLNINRADPRGMLFLLRGFARILLQNVLWLRSDFVGRVKSRRPGMISILLVTSRDALERLLVITK